MDPWLEHPAVWPDVHHSLITDLARDLTAQLAPRYVARTGERVAILSPERFVGPDVLVLRPRGGTKARRRTPGRADEGITILLEPIEVVETYVEIRSLQPERRLVTVIEVLSPGNKRPGSDSRAKYLEKQQQILASDVHLVEIDLLRSGHHTVAIPEGLLPTLRPHQYLAVVRRAGRRRTAQVFPIALRERLPRIPIPLLEDDPDAAIDLQSAIEGVHAGGAYETDLDYSRPPVPPLDAASAAWARKLLGRERKR